MKIGKLELELSAPDAERLRASAGVSIAEMGRMLDVRVIAGVVAKAVNACLAEAHDAAELAREIAAEGVDSVRAEVGKLYREADDVLELTDDVNGEETPDGQEQAA